MAKRNIKKVTVTKGRDEIGLWTRVVYRKRIVRTFRDAYVYEQERKARHFAADMANQIGARLVLDGEA